MNNKQDLAQKLGIGVGRVEAIAKELGFPPATEYSDEHAEKIKIVSFRMKELETGDIAKAITSLRQPQQQSAATSTVEGDRINSFADINAEEMKEAQRLAAVKAEQFKQTVSSLRFDFVVNGTPRHLLKPKEIQQIEDLGKQSEEAFETLVVQAIPQLQQSLTGRQFTALPSA